MVLPEILTLSEAHAVLKDLRSALAGSGPELLRIDAGPLKVFDSAALALLLEAARQARFSGKSLRIDAASEPLKQLAALYGVAQILGLHTPTPTDTAGV